MMVESTTLKAAILMWKRGYDIPLDVEATLLYEGYDVQYLRSIYLG